MFIESEEMVILEKDINMFNDVREQLAKLNADNTEGWLVHKNTEEQKIFYKQEDYTNITLFMSTTVKAPAMNAVSLMVECQLFKEWMPLCTRSHFLAKKSNLR